jgi:uncharacterized membrane protein
MEHLMGKMEFIEALKRALAGLAPELQAKTLAYYEQRFVDGVSAGRTEQDIAKQLGDPKHIALTLRANTHMKAFEQAKTPFNLLRFLVSAVGLLIFNLFMLVPAMVYAGLLAGVYAGAMGLYVTGIAVTSFGLAGANEFVLDGPMSHFVIDDEGNESSDMTQTRVMITEKGVRVNTEKMAEHEHSDHGPREGKLNAIERAENLANRGIHISTDMDADARATQSAFGLAMVLGGIILFLISLVVTRYTLIGIKRYAQMNVSLLKGN